MADSKPQGLTLGGKPLASVLDTSVRVPPGAKGAVALVLDDDDVTVGGALLMPGGGWELRLDASVERDGAKFKNPKLKLVATW